jgi:hypothetical protein
VAQRSPLGEVFYVVALTVLPAVLFLGLVTFVRVLQSSVEDILFTMPSAVAVINGLLAGVTVAFPTPGRRPTLVP